MLLWVESIFSFFIEIPTTTVMSVELAFWKHVKIHFFDCHFHEFAERSIILLFVFLVGVAANSDHGGFSVTMRHF